jgi:hypothetical protein
VKLEKIAHSRTGDKGNDINISVIAYRQEDYQELVAKVTEEKVHDHFSRMIDGPVTRYEIPSIHALNFVLKNALAGGVTRSLRIDKHGKSLASFLLEMEI